MKTNLAYALKLKVSLQEMDATRNKPNRAPNPQKIQELVAKVRTCEDLNI